MAALFESPADVVVCGKTVVVVFGAKSLDKDDIAVVFVS